MKRKIFSILLTLVLVLSLNLVTAAPVGAQPETLNVIPFTLEAEAPATSDWSQAEANTGSSSVKLYDDGTSYANVWFDLPGGVTLAQIDLDTTSFFCKSTAGDWIPYLMFEMPGSFPVGEDTGNLFRINCDGDESAGYSSWTQFVASSTTPEWQWEIIDTTEWTVLDSGWDIWADLVTEHGALVVEMLVVEISGLAGTNTAYVDDITVNGTTYYGLIQDAIDSATGTTILVADGTYTEDLVVDTANLTLKSVNGRDFTTIQGVGDWVIELQDGSSGFTLGGTDVHGFKVIGGANSTVLLGTVNGPSGVEVSYNTFDTTGNANMAIAVGAQGAADLNISHNAFDLYGDTGIYFDTGDVTNLLIDTNAFTGVSGSPKWLNWAGNAHVNGAMIRNNIVNDANVAIRMYSRTNLFEHVTFSGNTIAGGYIAIGPGDDLNGVGVITSLSITGNSFTGPADEQVFFEIMGPEGAPFHVETDAIDWATLTVNNNNFDAAPGEHAIKNWHSGTSLKAECNWWGSASGPTHNSNPLGTGALITDYVDYEPWLLVAGGPCYQQAQALKDGWTLVSTDNWIDCETLITPATTSWQGVTVAYKYIDSIVGYEEAFVVDLVPVNALYLKTEGGGGIGIVYSGGVPVASSKDLEAGWNLISSATHDNARAVLSPLRYIDVGEEQGVGLATLVSQGKYNRYSESFYLATVVSYDWAFLLSKTLNPFDGYWVYMNAGKTFGVIPD